MQTNSSFTKIIRKHAGEQMSIKHKSKANKPKRIIIKRGWL